MLRKFQPNFQHYVTKTETLEKNDFLRRKTCITVDDSCNASLLSQEITQELSDKSNNSIANSNISYNYKPQ